MPPIADPDLCDEFAYSLLSYASMAEVVSSRYECPEISGYYYRGPFEDDIDMLIGPDYSILLADPTLNYSTNIEAYACGFRTPLKKAVEIDSCNSRWEAENFWKV